MAHDWKRIVVTMDSPVEQIQGALSGIVYRRCRNCGKEQGQEPEWLWGRVVGYKWRPLAGRCKPVGRSRP